MILVKLLGEGVVGFVGFFGFGFFSRETFLLNHGFRSLLAGFLGVYFTFLVTIAVCK